MDVSDNPEDIVGLITICFDEKRMVITRRACVGNSEILIRQFSDGLIWGILKCGLTRRPDRYSQKEET